MKLEVLNFQDGKVPTIGESYHLAAKLLLILRMVGKIIHDFFSGFFGGGLVISCSFMTFRNRLIGRVLLLHMSVVFDNPFNFLKYAMYSPIRSESKLRLNQSLIMASQPTPPNVLPQK